MMSSFLLIHLINISLIQAIKIAMFYSTYQKTVNEDEYVCLEIEPIRNSHTSPSCEILLLQSPPSIPKSCYFQETSDTLSLWHRLGRKNQWIYILTEKTTMTIDCKGQIQFNFTPQHKSSTDGVVVCHEINVCSCL